MVKKQKKKAVKSSAKKRVAAKGSSECFQREKFATDILTARHGSGKSQRAVGQDLKISSAGLTFLERGECVPSAENFARLCKFYKLSPLSYL